LVQIRGRIGVFRGKPELEIKSADAVRIIEREEPVSGLRRPSPLVSSTDRHGCNHNVLNLFDDHNDPIARTKDAESRRSVASPSIRAQCDAVRRGSRESRRAGVFCRTMLMDMGYREVVSFESNDVRHRMWCLSRFPVGPVTSHRFRDFDDGMAAGWSP
jgi:hypothetical protein